MTKQKTLKQLIDEVIEEYAGRINQLGDNELWKFVRSEEMFNFFRQSLLKIAVATAEAGRGKKKTTEGLKEHGVLWERRWAFNTAIDEQQQKLKAFMGEYYEEK